MRITLIERDLNLVKKAAKILRRHWPSKLGQQKALNHVATLLGYPDYFHLTHEVSSSAEESDLDAFGSHTEISLRELGLAPAAAEAILSTWGRLSAFNTERRPIRFFIDEASEYFGAAEKSRGSDVVDLLSGLGLPRYEWWVSEPGTTNIHDPSVVVLNQVIPLIRQLKEELNWGPYDRQDTERSNRMVDHILTHTYPGARVSAFHAVSETDISARPFGFRVVEGVLVIPHAEACKVWAIQHPDTFSFLEPVFSTRDAAMEVLAGVALTGKLQGPLDAQTEGMATFSLDTQVHARVVAGHLVDAVEAPDIPSDTVPHHQIHAGGFKMIQFRNLDAVRLRATAFKFPEIGDTQPQDRDGYDYSSIPDTPREMGGSVNAATLRRLRDLQASFNALVREAREKIQNDLPLHTIEWLHHHLVSQTHVLDPEHDYDIEPTEMAEHVPQLCKHFPQDLLDNWYYSFVDDTQACRPFGHTVGDPWEFLGYLAYRALTGSDPQRSQDVEIGAILLSRQLEDDKIGTDMLNQYRRSLEGSLKVLDGWKDDISQVKHGLHHIQPDKGMISHGAQRTTMSDMFRMGRKYKAEPLIVTQSIG